MRTRPILTLVAALAFAGAEAWDAEPKETLEMADGSVYMGHTSRQNLVGGKFQFLYDSATIVLPRKDVGSLTRSQTDFDRLPEAWKNWFAGRPQYIQFDSDGKRSVNLYRLVDKDGVSTNVFLFSRSPEYIKYYTLNAGSASLADADIRIVRYGRRDALDITGIVTEIETVDGETVRGQLAEDGVEGKGILTDENVVEIIPADKIASLRRLPLDSASGIENQIEFLDQISVNASADQPTSYTGIITYMNYRTDGKPDPYIVVYDPNKPEEEGSRVASASLVSKSKAPNPFYAPLRDFQVASDDAMYVNGVEMTAAPFIRKEKEQEFSVEAEKVDPMVVTPEDGNVVLAMRNVDSNSKITLIPIKKQTKRRNSYYRFGYGNLFEHAIQGTRKVSRNGVASITYSGLADGVYLVFNQDNKKIYLFRIGEEEAEG